MNNAAMEFIKEPISVTWWDILQLMSEGEERVYGEKSINGIRAAISRRLKYTHPHMSFTTDVYKDANGDMKIKVRRLTSNEITQQQPSA